MHSGIRSERLPLFVPKKHKMEVITRAIGEYFCHLPEKCELTNLCIEGGTAVKGALCVGGLVGAIPAAIAASIGYCGSSCCSNDPSQHAQGFACTTGIVVGAAPALVGGIFATVVTSPCVFCYISAALEENKQYKMPPPTQQSM